MSVIVVWVPLWLYAEFMALSAVTRLELAVIAALLIARVVHVRRIRAERYQAFLAAFGWAETLDGVAFEHHCAAYLRQRGWTATTTRASTDHGVDVIAEKRGLRVAIQCKRYSKPVGNKAVQEVLAGKAFISANRAAVVSNATYTPAAHELARRTGVLLLHFTDLARADQLFAHRSGH